MNKIFVSMYQNRLFSLSDASKIVKNYQVRKNNINRLVKQGLISRLKGGLYFVKPLDNHDFYPDPIHIASKLRPDAIICANTALRVLKLSNPNVPEPTIYISSKHASKSRIGKYTYKILSGQNFGVDKIEYLTSYGRVDIKITDVERTIIDCIKTRSVRADELINILRSKPLTVSFKKFQTYLEKYDMPILYSKVGLILELCKSNLKIDDSDIEKLRKKLSKKIYYYKERGIKLIRPRYKYFKEWNIMIPEQLFELSKSMSLKTGL